LGWEGKFTTKFQTVWKRTGTSWELRPLNRVHGACPLYRGVPRTQIRRWSSRDVQGLPPHHQHSIFIIVVVSSFTSPCIITVFILPDTSTLITTFTISTVTNEETKRGDTVKEAKRRCADARRRSEEQKKRDQTLQHPSPHSPSRQSPMKSRSEETQWNDRRSEAKKRSDVKKRRS
jgi:hypothetical protein